jgi:putative hydrolase of the HAD superfamily
MKKTNLSEVVAGADAVVFDLFHTLTSIESVTSWGRPTHEILGVTREAWLEELFENSRDRLIGRIRDPFEMISMMARALNPEISQEAIQEAVDNRTRRFENALTRIPETSRGALTRLKASGKKLGLVSNADTMEAAAWDRSPVAGLFDCALFSCDVGYAKPEPEIYEMCLEKLAAVPSEAVFVGDGGSDELKGARAVGMTTVMMTGVIGELWPERIEPRLPDADFVIARLDELVMK